jgi:glycosyltransferase involved in cell wall biosynthesis
MLSVVIPVYNEADNVDRLYSRLVSALEALEHSFEIILINDGSQDETESRLSAMAQCDNRVKVVNFRRNFGQTAAMMAGIDHATGDIIVPMDGDLQNDPDDIGRLITKLDEGFDVVSGWRKDRKDSEWRNLPSRVANSIISRISGVRLHDYGCSLKAYRREVIKGVRLYGEMHRFIPIYASWQGAKVTEIPVRHHARTHGVSKYGMERIAKVVLDLIVVKFMADFATKPIYIFGGFGILSIFLSATAGLAALYLKFTHGISFILTPLPLLTALTFITGVMSILMGLLAEIVMRTYHESQDKPVYLVKSTMNLDR